MKKKIVILIAVFTLLATTVVMTGCGSSNSDWNYVKKNGQLVIGLDDTFAPMGFRDKNDKLVGFDIDLARAVCKELGIKAKFKPIDWSAKYSELKAKNIDCIWNGMSATKERASKLSLSKEYLNNKIIIMTYSNKVKIASAADLKKYEIGTQDQSAALETMQADKAYKSFKSKIKTYKSYDDALLDMKAGRIDCIVIDQVLGRYKNTNLHNALKECSYNFGNDYYAIGFRKSDTELTKKVNTALKKTIDSGEAKKISKKWFGKNIVIYKDYK